MKFEITEDHIKLLRAANVRWEDCEFGAPAIDCKRPYGNSSVYQDIIEICGFDIREDEYGDLIAEDRVYLRQLHAETETALQIFLCTGKMETGIYEQQGNKYEWKRVGGIRRKVL